MVVRHVRWLVFSGRTRIISADIAVFDASDLNPNVMLEMGGVFLGPAGDRRGDSPGTDTPVTFTQGATRVTIAPGASAWSDLIDLSFVTPASVPLLAGRKLAVSLHVVGTTGPMTYHAKALTTSSTSGA